MLAIICENTFDPSAAAAPLRRDSIPEHGLGLKIIEGIVEKYEGIMDTEKKNDRFRVRIVIPLTAPAPSQETP